MNELDLIAESISETLDAPVTKVLNANPTSYGISGYLISDGGIYEYAASPKIVELNYLPEESRDLNEYTLGILETRGIHTDSDRPYDWATGYLRMDVKCVTGKPCGNRCIPKNKKCRAGFGGDAAQKVGQAIGQVHQNLQNNFNKNVQHLQNASASMPNPHHVAAGVAAIGALGAVGAAALHHFGKNPEVQQSYSPNSVKKQKSAQPPGEEQENPPKKPSQSKVYHPEVEQNYSQNSGKKQKSAKTDAIEIARTDLLQAFTTRL